MIKAELLDHMGDDLMVVNAARVSFDKRSEWEYDPCCGPQLSERDRKLIRYLADHGHWSPFAHPQAQFRVSAPIFVARQLAKHQVGAAWNEVSRRYVDSEPVIYRPETWRRRAENAKQGSKHDEHWSADIGPWADGVVDEAAASALDAYKSLLSQGVCPEQARAVLPQSTMTEWIWTGSLLFFSRVCRLRLDSHAQHETQLVARQIADQMESLFPNSWAALNG